VTRYLTTERLTAMSQADARIVKALEGYRGGSALRFGVDLASTRELIDSATLLGFDEAQRLCELGNAIACARWGKGYATEALTGALDDRRRDGEQRVPQFAQEPLGRALIQRCYTCKFFM
jgi:RimJ/RimL family protein N-acetyltransferase